MDESTALKCVLEVFRDRNIAFDKEEINSVVKSEEGKAWVEEHLSHETLLTKDELALYEALEKSGEAATLADTNDLSIVCAHDEDELKSAIEELQRSTAAIEKQSETLRIQQDAMKSLVRSNRSASASRGRAVDLQQRKWASSREQLSAEMDELSAGLSQRIAEHLQQRKITDASYNHTAVEFLRADDRLLLSLQKLAGELEPERKEDAEVSGQINHLCARLIKFTVQGIRIRLDRIYLEALQSPPPREISNSDDLSDAEIRALQEELESLYSEILPVAQMSVEQQYLQPALRMISSNQDQGRDRSLRALEYMSQCLTFISTRLSKFQTLTNELRSHQTALTHLTHLIQKEVLPSNENETTTTKPTEQSKPPRQRSKGNVNQRSSRDYSPQKRRSAALGTVDYEDLSPPHVLLRTLGITLPSPSTAQSPSSTSHPAPAISTHLRTRSTQLQTHQQTLSSTLESSISSHIQEQRMTLQLLRDSLMSETRWNGVRLVEREVEEAVRMLEGDLGVVKEMGSDGGLVDLEKLGGRNVWREDFVGRWGGEVR